jgi:putative membrane protein
LKFFATALAATLLLTGSALAQNAGSPATPARPASPGTNSPTGSSNPAVNTGGNASSSVNASGTATIVKASALEKGANSFTEGQAKSRLEGAGLTKVSELKKDDQGVWRGTAMRNGKPVKVGFDYKGNIAAE